MAKVTNHLLPAVEIRDFLASNYKDLPSGVFAGIDPGLSGALGVIDTTSIEHPLLRIFRIPIRKDTWKNGSVRNRMDGPRLSDLILSQPRPTRALIEELRPGPFSKVASFSLGCSMGMLQGITIAHRWPIEEIRPKDWQAELEMGSHEDPKERSIAFAEKVFGLKTRNHNFTDAACLAFLAWTKGANK